MAVAEDGSGGSGPPSSPVGKDLAKADGGKPPAVPSPAQQATLNTPPLPPGAQFNVAMGVMQKPDLFATLSPELQREMLTAVDKIDQRGFQHAQEHLASDERIKTKQLEERSKGRKHLYVLAGIGLLLGVGSGLTVTIMLINAGKHELAYTVMMSGIGVVGAFLGGTGVASALKKASS